MPNSRQDVSATGRSDAIRVPQSQRSRLITRRQTSYLLATGAAISIAGAVRLVDTNRPLSVVQSMQFIQQLGDRMVGGAMKIVDVMAEGASMRITQRDDLASFLSHNNHSIPALPETLRHQVEAAS